jgi:hypothetical protein
MTDPTNNPLLAAVASAWTEADRDFSGVEIPITMVPYVVQEDEDAVRDGIPR